MIFPKDDHIINVCGGKFTKSSHHSIHQSLEGCRCTLSELQKCISFCRNYIGKFLTWQECGCFYGDWNLQLKALTYTATHIQGRIAHAPHMIQGNWSQYWILVLVPYSLKGSVMSLYSLVPRPRPPAFRRLPYWKRRKAGWGLGTRLVSVLLCGAGVLLWNSFTSHS